MQQLILIFHVLAALGIIGLILLQQGKGASMGASFGAGASQTMLGSQGGGSLLTKLTAVLATLFFVTSFGLAIAAKDNAISAGKIDLPDAALVESSVVKAPAAKPADVSEIPVVDQAERTLPASSEVPVSE